MPHAPSSSKAVVRRGESVVDGRLPEETVLLRTDSGRTVRLNTTAAWLWDQLESPLSLEELGGRLRSEFGLDEEQARTDAARFAGELAERGFLAVDSPAG
jgi:Coenzyme PQQ synthesis protein D (PqqD)